MKLIVGLGNPGTKYSRTRHNVGRLLMERIAGDQGGKFENRKSLAASTCELDWKGHPAVLAYPETYMNVSGRVVKNLLEHYHLVASRDLLVVVDDVALPFGKWRLRERGSDGGHNGLKSVNEAIATSHYSRLRCGIADPSETPSKSFSKTAESLEAYVLEPFRAEEAKKLDRVLAKGAEACWLWVSRPMADAMNAVNPDKN